MSNNGIKRKVLRTYLQDGVKKPKNGENGGTAASGDDDYNDGDYEFAAIPSDEGQNARATAASGGDEAVLYLSSIVKLTILTAYSNTSPCLAQF